MECESEIKKGELKMHNDINVYCTRDADEFEKLSRLLEIMIKNDKNK